MAGTDFERRVESRCLWTEALLLFQVVVIHPAWEPYSHESPADTGNHLQDIMPEQTHVPNIPTASAGGNPVCAASPLRPDRAELIVAP
jgi:hypothetical protein